MATKKKIVFIIVEGISDKMALATIMSKLINTEEVIVEFTGGDFTTKSGVTPSNIAAIIGDFIRTYSKPYSFQASDFLEVIHIIDTDGAFIGSDKVLEADVENIIYDCDSIKTQNCQGIIDRNRSKTENVKKLIALSKIWRSVPYGVYYFSCNLEHVLHNNANVPWTLKSELATQFAKEFRDQPEKFLSFIQNKSFSVSKSYLNSWNYIMEEENSLKKHTNLNLIFSAKAKNIKRNLLIID